MMQDAPIRITSVDNPRFRRWKKLALDPRAPKKEGLALAEGIHTATAAMEAGSEIVSVITREGALNDEAAAVLRVASRVARVHEVPRDLYEAIAPVPGGSGVMIEFRTGAGKDSLAAQSGRDAVFLDGVQDPGNAGTLIRTAVASGVKMIVASPATASLWSPKVLRSAMGAHFGARIFEGVTARAAREALEGRFLAADARGGRDIFGEPGWEKGPVVWLLGAEGPGLSDAALSVADMRLYIPIEPETESLNVAAAAAVCLFEQRRRRICGSRAAKRER